MEPYLWWAIISMALVIAELVSGTFYLLVLGIAGFAGAAASYLHYSFGVQAVGAAAVATVGVILVNRFRAGASGTPDVGLDVGQSVVLDNWVSEQGRLARVRYRNALWDATVLDDQGVAPGDTLRIKRVEGNTLYVSKNA